MHIVDNSRFLLYIEPRKEEKSDLPVNDEITEIMEMALSDASCGAANYSDLNSTGVFNFNCGFKGIHHTSCGKVSDNHDYLLKNGMITNSLCVYYLQYYRNSIPPSEMDKVMELVSFYKQNF